MSEVEAPEQTNRPTAGTVEERTAGGVVADGRKIRGLIPYGTESRDLGGWKEVIEATAFNSTDVSELRAVIDHKGIPLARYPKTLDVEDSPEGLRWSVDPPRSRQDVVEAIERGDMRAGSWRMVVGKDEWRGDTRHVHEVSELLDVTLVGAEEPAYPAASVELRTSPRVRVVNEPREERDKEHKMEAENRSSEERRGGLEWGDIDFEGNRIYVQRRLYQGVLDRPKNGKAKTIALTPPAKEALHGLPSFDQPPVEGAELVFRSKQGKRLSQPTLTAYWAQVRARASLEHDFYLATKHLGVHLLYKLGLSKRAIAAQMGWSEKNVGDLLRIYGHADLVALAEVDALYADAQAMHEERDPAS
jgi:uncharacterized protein